MPIHIGQEIKKVMLDKGISQAQLAEIINQTTNN